MGKHQRERARAQRAAFKVTSQPTSVSSLPASSMSPSPSPLSAPSPHHVDLLRLAFLEWLLPLKALTSAHELWDRFMADWEAIPGHELPVQSSRPRHTVLSRASAAQQQQHGRDEEGSEGGPSETDSHCGRR